MLSKRCLVIVCLGLALFACESLIGAQKTAVGQHSSRKVERRLLWGFIDKRGKVVVPPSFDGVRQFHEGRAMVREGNKIGYIDKTGRMVIEAKFKAASDFSEGLASVVTPERQVGYIDSDGKWVIKPQFDSGESFSEGLAFVMNKSADGNYSEGYIDKAGRMVIKGLGGGPFSRGTALVSGEEHQLFLIDKMGNRVSPDIESSSSVLRYSEGLAVFNKNNNWKWGYIDTKGRVAIKQQFDSARDFHEGLASVSFDDGRIGFIDKNGKWIIKPRTTWQFAGDFSEGLAGAQSRSGLFGFVDKTGRWAIAPKFSAVGDFSDGVAVAYRHKDRKWGYIDKRGHWVIVRPVPPVNPDNINVDDEQWAFHEGLAPVAAKQ